MVNCNILGAERGDSDALGLELARWLYAASFTDMNTTEKPQLISQTSDKLILTILKQGAHRKYNSM